MPRASSKYCKSTPSSKMGFSQRASCKAQGLLARSSKKSKGKFIKSSKYSRHQSKRKVKRASK